MITPVNQQHSRIADLEETIRCLEVQRDLEIRRRRRNVLIVGVSLSLLVHLGLMLYLNLLHRSRPVGTGVQPVSIEFAVVAEQELTQLEDLQLEDLVPEVPMDLDLPDLEPSLDLDAEVSAASLDIAPSGSVPTLSGSGAGSGGDATLDGGGAGTSFFGVSSRGTRFAYVVDVSGSMSYDSKIEVAMRELARSIESLPDYAYFYVVLFSSDLKLPAIQRGWTRARPNTISRLIRWLNEQVDPVGGTRPSPAFFQVFGLDRRPDVIFFLTDGEIPPDTAANVTSLNSRGRRVVINTIAFGDSASQAQLKDIARRSGGVYRFVPSNRW